MKRNTFRDGLKNFLDYSKSERNATLILGGMLLVLVVASIFFRPIFLANSTLNTATYERIDSFFSSVRYVEPDRNIDSKHDIVSEELPIKKVREHFYFNPNTISADSLVDLGLSPKQAQVILNYRSKGGKFNIPDDFSKIHVIDSSTFARLKPWIRIASNCITFADTSNGKKITEILLVELNSADTIALTKLKGIGRSFARRIVSYRDLLGGFYSINQLSEVYGLSPDVVNSIKQNLRLDSSAIRRININLVSYEELKGHPYITDYQAKSIIYYRSKKGTIGGIAELMENKLLPDDRFQKIAPYLTVK